MLNDPVSKYTDHQMTAVDGHFTVDSAAKIMMDSQVESYYWRSVLLHLIILPI